MKKKIKLLSPAKVNLFFHVIKKREDNYHEIASIFQTVSLSDVLHISTSHVDKLTCNDASLKCDETNLVSKAISIFRQKMHVNTCFDIHLEKNIPIQAGLGGGSSNAATTLFGINELLGRPASEKELLECSKILGADVSFFLSKGTAFCTGFGDIVKDIDFIDLNFYIAKPDFGMNTQAVFEILDLNGLNKIDLKKIQEDYLMKKYQFFNDLEKNAFFLDPRMKTIKQDLLKLGFDEVVMTGSGSAFLCFGKPKSKILKNITFYPVVSIQRKTKKWYPF